MRGRALQGFADELSKLAISMPGQGTLRALRAKGLAGAAQAQQKASVRAAKMHNIAPVQTKNLSNLPEPPRFNQ